MDSAFLLLPPPFSLPSPLHCHYLTPSVALYDLPYMTDKIEITILTI